MNQKKCYVSIEHTGDLGVEVWGKSLKELLENASIALIDTIAEVNSIHPHVERKWKVLGSSPEELLIHQLEEVLFQLDAKGMIYSSFSIKISPEGSAECTARGEEFSRENHGFKTELKAITYHQLKIWQDERGVFRARVIFDV